MSKVNEQDYITYLELINDGYSQRKAAKILGVPRTTLQDYIKRKQKCIDGACIKQQVIDGICSNDYSNWERKEKPPITFDVDVEKYNFPNLQDESYVTKKPVSKRKPTICVIADTQCKPTESLEYILWIGQYISEKKPDIIVMIGDWWDFPSLSSYDKGKASSEGRRFVDDLQAGNKGLELLEMEINKDSTYKPRKVFCKGNHEHRVDRYVEDNPELKGTLGTEFLPLKEYGWEVYDFLKPVEIEGVFFVHYLANSMSGKPYGGTASSILKTVGRSFVVGHKQCLDITIRPTIDGKQQIGIINGAAYPFDEKYKGHQGNSHFRGITMLHEVQDGFGLPSFISINHLKERYYS